MKDKLIMKGDFIWNNGGVIFILNINGKYSIVNLKY